MLSFVILIDICEYTNRKQGSKKRVRFRKNLILKMTLGAKKRLLVQKHIEHSTIALNVENVN